MASTSRKCPSCGNNRTLKTFSARAKMCQYCAKKSRSHSAHASHVKRTYNITAEEYAAILAFQGGGCAACGGGAGRRRLPVDHDHKVEEAEGTRASIRGLLCKRHNNVLRDVRDSVPVLLALIAYLEDPPAQKVLCSRS